MFKVKKSVLITAIIMAFVVVTIASIHFFSENQNYNETIKEANNLLSIGKYQEAYGLLTNLHLKDTDKALFENVELKVSELMSDDEYMNKLAQTFYNEIDHSYWFDDSNGMSTVDIFKRAWENASLKYGLDNNTAENLYQIAINNPSNFDLRNHAQSYKPSEEREESLTDDIIGFAVAVAQEAVKTQLKSPSTANFPNSFEEYKISESNGTYTVISYVDADNSLGANIRVNYKVSFEIDSNGKSNNVQVIIFE